MMPEEEQPAVANSPTKKEAAPQAASSPASNPVLNLATPAAKPSKPRIPPAVDGIQYNCCKNPKCPNFGIPAEEQVSRGRTKDQNNNRYTISGTGNKNSSLRCNSCGQYPPIKSNLGIQQEIERLTSYLHPKVYCPDENCKNHTVPFGTQGAYRKFGFNRSGTPRYKCNECNKTFSFMRTDAYQRDTHFNRDIFSLLVNKMPLNRIVSHLNISWDVLYRRIDYIYDQCRLFAANREAKLKTLPIERIYLAVDRQDYVINWSERKDKRNITINAISSADNLSGYVFAINPNYDADVDSEAIEAECAINGDNELGIAYRKNSRVWLKVDYQKSVANAKPKKQKEGELEEQIQITYDNAANREDIEVSDEQTRNTQLPKKGMLVHSDYTMVAHFFLLKDMMKQVKKWRIFMDQEAGIRSAVMYAFMDEIKSHLCEAFYISIAKGMSVNDKEAIKAEVDANFRQYKNANPGLDGHSIRILMWLDEFKYEMELGEYKDKWWDDPTATMNEPKKKLCWLTEHDMDEKHLAAICNRASLHSVDTFFQKLRRRNNQLERPIHTASNVGRVWNGYGFYNPAQVHKILEIMRVVHNYIDIRKKKNEGERNEIPLGATYKTTPAVELGLAKTPLDFNDVLRYE